MRLPEHFYKKISEELGIDYKIVDKVNKYYWKEGVRKSISEGNYNGVFVKGIGTFYLSRNNVAKAVRKHIGYIRWYKRKVLKNEERKTEKLEQLYKVLRELLSMRNLTAIERCKKIERLKRNGKIV